jgi:hypothetical protein
MEKRFKVYEAIRESGLTNMFDIKKVIFYSNGQLTKEDILDIMKNYSTYKNQLDEQNLAKN